MAPPRDPPEGFSDSDRQWFDRLSGKPGVVTDAQAIREADALKQALRAEIDAQGAGEDDAELQRQWEQLQFRARREGVQPRPATPWRQRWPAIAGLAAVPLWQGGDGGYDAPPVMRGDHVLREQRTAEPRESAEAFAAALRQAGLKPGLYRRDKTFVVDIDLKPEQLPAAEPAFARLALQATPGTTRVEFARP
jgi:hypothetical protein